MEATTSNRRYALVISSLRRGGAEKILASIANHLALQGARVRILTFELPGSTSFYPLDPRIERVDLDATGDSPHVIASIFATVRRVVRLRRALKEGEPEAVLSFMGRTNIRVLLAAFGLRIPVIVSERSHPLREDTVFVWKTLRCLLYPRARFVVAPTERAGFAVRLRSSDRARAIPNPVAPLAATETLSEGMREKTFVAMGRLIPRKGFDVLIRAFQQIADEHPEWTLRLYGEGPEKDSLRRLAASMGAGSRVRFEGVGDPGAAFARAGVFALPSLYEGFPNVLCEAMAAGTAVIAADCEFGPREILANGEGGILVPPGEAGPLAQAMSRLARNDELRAEQGRRAAHAVGRYAPDVVLPQWESLLAEASQRKILVVLPSLRRGGAERAASWLTRAWAVRHRVSLAVFNGADRAYDAGVAPQDLGLPSARGRLGKALNALRRVVALRGLMRRGPGDDGPDVIFSFMESANFPVLLAALSHGMHRRVTVSVRGNPAEMSRGHRIAIALLYGWAGRIACVSQGVADNVAARLPFGAGRVVVRRSALDLEGIARLAAEPLPAGGPYFFAAGRLVAGKDFDRMIRLFAEARCDGAQLFIAGEGPERPRLEARIRALELVDRVHLLGALQNPFSWMRGALGFLMTSRHEGFPMVLIESMACGTPFVAFDCDYGPREAAPGGHGGFVVPMDDDRTFVRRMEQLCSDEALRDSMRAAAQERAADFSFEKTAASWLRREGKS